MLEAMAPTYNVGLQSFGHQATCDLQILWRTLSHLQTTGHAHTLQHLYVIVDLKHAVKIEQILEPAGEKEQATSEGELSSMFPIYFKGSLRMLPSSTVFQ